MTFAMVSDAAWPGSDQQPWGTAPPAGPVGWLDRPMRPGSGLRFVLPCLSAVLVAHVCAVSMAPWRVFTDTRAQRVLVCGVLYHFALQCFVRASSVATSRLITVVRPRCNLCAVTVAGWRMFTIVRPWCVVCAVSLATWCLFTAVRAFCVLSAVSLAT